MNSTGHSSPKLEHINEELKFQWLKLFIHGSSQPSHVDVSSLRVLAACADTFELFYELPEESTKDEKHLHMPGAFFTLLAACGATSDSTQGGSTPLTGSSGKSTPFDKASV